MPRPNRTGIRGLFKDGRGYYIDLQYRDREGTEQRYKERIPPGTTAGAARLRMQQVLADMLAGTLTKRSAGPQAVRLRQAFDQYLEWVKTNRPKAHRNRKSIVAVWLATVGDVPIDRLGTELVESYKSKRLAAKAAPATINRGVAMLKHMCGVAARAGWSWMNRERAALIGEVGMLKEPPGRQRPIKPAELDALIAAFWRKDSRFARRVVAADLLSGCRLDELLSLRTTEVDLRRKVIDLSRTKQNRLHQVVITPPLAALLKEALAESKGGFAFVNRFGKPYTGSGFSKHFANVAERAGCPDVTFHDLRRHVGTVLINAGERLEVVSKLLGHSNVAVTQRSYAHLATDATRAAFAKLASFSPSIPPDATRAPRKRRKTG